MKPRFCLIGTAVASALLLGCDQAPEGAAPVPPTVRSSPATRPVKPAATAPVEPTSSLLSIHDQLFQFPPAKLRLIADDDPGAPLHALLYSEDSVDAFDDGYAGNSYYLEMMLDVDDPKDLARATWQFKAPTSERLDSPNGIFLDGAKQQLQPVDVRVEFEGEKSPVNVWLTGSFLLFDSTDMMLPPEMVIVQAKLSADLLTKE